MKRYVLTAIILATLIFTICSCSEKVSESKAENTETTIESFITSKNVYDTIVETKKSKNIQ